MASKLRTVIYLFRNDLRIHDNEALLWAHRNSDFIVPLFCFDPDHFKGTWHFNFAKTGIHRAKFMLQSVENLKENLQKTNSDLVVENVKPLESIKRIIEYCKNISCPVVDIVYQKEVTFEEVNVENEIKKYCQSQNIKVMELWGSSLYHASDIPCRNIPDNYTQFRKEVENKARIRPLQNMPDKLKPLPKELPTGNMPNIENLYSEPNSSQDYTKVDQRSAFPYVGGETSGLDRLNHYLWKSHAVATYKQTRNGLIGVDYSTKFSPWLALGCLSPRKIFWEIKKYEEHEVSNQSTYWVIFELIWRDYFKFVCQKYGDSVFYLTGILNKHLDWSQDKKKFQAWKEGRTGVPFVDANMRELKETGWMSNRGRQNVASFLIKDLGIDWRMGAEWFESQLLDHDVCSNYGNWNYAAGIGNDPRENRKFNMVKQGMDYDSQGEYIRLWVEELRGIKDGRAHFPWTLSGAELSKSGIELGVTYPNPIVIAPEWSRHTNTKKDRGPPTNKAQKGIDFYFKSDGTKKTGNPSGGGGNPNKKAYKGKRIQ